jgi:predicted transcriptional regulator
MARLEHPEDIALQLRLYGERIRTARVRRRWSKEELATRVGVERRTVARLEEGVSGVSLGVFLTAIWVLGLWETIQDVAAPEADKTGMFLEKQRQPRHVHRKRKKELDF